MPLAFRPQNTQDRPVTVCNSTNPPPCADKRFGFCISDDSYPMDHITVCSKLIFNSLTHTNRYYATQATIENYSELVNQFSYKSIPKEEIIHRPIKIDKKGPCLSTNVFIKPIRMPSINGNWRVIVQDAKDIIQRERIVLCTRAGDVCQMPPEKLFAPLQCHTSRCSQKFIVRQLLAYDPCDPTRGIFVDSFKIPSACSCLFFRSTC